MKSDMPDYTKGKIYKLQCADGYYYIGSTCDTLRGRMWDHKDASETGTTRVYQHINRIGWDKVTMILVEDYPCETKDQLRQREDVHIQMNRSQLCLNTDRAYVTERERLDMRNQSQQIRRQKAEKVICLCGGIFHPDKIRRHEATAKHQTFLASSQ